ncbi:GMC family oxidoreductase [Burkholderia sp. 3C]
MLTDGASAARSTADPIGQKKALEARYDFIVCGSGSSGSVVASRLAEGGSARVLLIEAGGTDDVSPVMEPAMWPANLGSERDWGFVAEENPHLHNRVLPMSMGKVLGGGSSINVMLWARGHRSDWDHFAAQTGDEGWGYDSVRNLYRSIESWHGPADPTYRGTSGPMHIEPNLNAHPVALATLDAAQQVGIPGYDSYNGVMMERDGGCSLTETATWNGKRHSVYRAYVAPKLHQANLTVLRDTVVTRVLLDGRRAVGVEILHGGRVEQVFASTEVVLSMGALQTPKVLMLSGIGDSRELERLAIPVAHHLPGVGQNLQDHLSFGCIWEYREPIAPRGTGNEVTIYWKSQPQLDAPDLLLCQAEFPVPSPQTAVRGIPEHGWTMFAGLAQPHSRGRVRLASSDPLAAPRIEHNALSHPADVAAARACIRLMREIGNASPLAPFVQREVLPGTSNPDEIDAFIRDAAVTYWHQSCTAKMGTDDMSVVGGNLKVHGIDNLRIADASVMPRITTGNPMAPCVVIGERAGSFIRNEYRL